MALPNTTIESATVDAANPGICRVVAITTHPPAGDKVRIWIAIPTSNWNGRFLGNGGGGFVGGSAARRQSAAWRSDLRQARPTPDTKAAARRFALDANGRLNWQAIRDFAHVGIHEMTVTGKALTQAMYGVRAALLVLQRVLDRRTAGTDGGAALSAGLQRHRRRRAGHQLDEAC